MEVDAAAAYDALPWLRAFANGVLQGHHQDLESAELDKAFCPTYSTSPPFPRPLPIRSYTPPGRPIVCDHCRTALSLHFYQCTGRGALCHSAQCLQCYVRRIPAKEVSEAQPHLSPLHSTPLMSPPSSSTGHVCAPARGWEASAGDTPHLRVLARFRIVADGALFFGTVRKGGGCTT